MILLTARVLGYSPPMRRTGSQRVVYNSIYRWLLEGDVGRVIDGFQYLSKRDDGSLGGWHERLPRPFGPHNDILWRISTEPIRGRLPALTGL